jgi:hypothetical protein
MQWSMSPEQAAIRSIDNRTRGIEIAETARVLLPMHEGISRKMAELAIKPESFIRPDDENDIYTHEMIARDNAYVKRMKEEFAKDALSPGPNGLRQGEVRDLAEILEYQIFKGMNIGNWIPFCKAIKTSEYDDIKNGMDLLVEFSHGDQINHFGIGVDVSFSHHLGKKFQRIKDEIDKYDGKKHRLGVIKYAKTPSSRGELHSLPRVVAALDLGVMKDLARTKNNALNGHMAQHTLIIEIARQLETFTEYAHSANPACVGPLERVRSRVEIMSKHLDSEARLEASEYAKNKDVNEAVSEGLRIFR